MDGVLSTTFSRIGSVFKPTFDAQKELDLVYKELSTIAGIKEMAASEGWVSLKDYLLGRVALYDDEIVALGSNPKRHENEIVKKHVMRTAFLDIVGAVNRTLDAEKGKVSKKQQLEKIIQDYEARQSVERQPVELNSL